MLSFTKNCQLETTLIHVDGQMGRHDRLTVTFHKYANAPTESLPELMSVDKMSIIKHNLTFNDNLNSVKKDI